MYEYDHSCAYYISIKLHSGDSKVKDMLKRGLEWQIMRFMYGNYCLHTFNICYLYIMNVFM